MRSLTRPRQQTARSRFALTKDELARRIDPEDVVQSAYRNVFLGARDGEFQLERGGDLWRLLAAITIDKLGKQIEHHQARKRDINAESRPRTARPPLN